MADDAPWAVESFDKRRHDRRGFDCGVNALDDWLATKVSQYEKRDLARTYVLIEAGQSLVRGYYAISNHLVVYDALPEDQAKGLPRIDVPLVLIGRLAVDRAVRGRRLGEFLLLDALRRCERLADKVGIRAVAVDALDESARRFYLKYGFLPLVDEPRRLFLPMQIIRKLKLPPL